MPLPSTQKYIVGLTGGIGSGKSAAADYFNTLGVTTVDADDSSRAVVEPGEPALDQIAERFGQGVLDAQGALDRAALRKQVFADAAARDWLQQLLHPLIGQHMHQALHNAPSPYAILVNAILLETRQNAWCDRVAVVDVSEAVQLARTLSRDDNTRAEVENIMKTQMSREQRLALADDVINNDGELQHLHHQIEELHTRYLTLCQTQ